jgi:hypothetical protein
VISIHKLTAGDGYSYLTRRVAAMDATDRGHTGLSDYSSQRGESPGQWLGSALADVAMAVGQEVTADHMVSLLGDGRHPNADQIGAQILRADIAGSTESGDAGATSAGTARDADLERFGLSQPPDFDSDGPRQNDRVESPPPTRRARRRYRGWVLASGGRR